MKLLASLKYLKIQILTLCILNLFLSLETSAATRQVEVYLVPSGEMYVKETLTLPASSMRHKIQKVITPITQIHANKTTLLEVSPEQSAKWSKPKEGYPIVEFQGIESKNPSNEEESISLKVEYLSAPISMPVILKEPIITEEGVRYDEIEALTFVLTPRQWEIVNDKGEKSPIAPLDIEVTFWFPSHIDILQIKGSQLSIGKSETQELKGSITKAGGLKVETKKPLENQEEVTIYVSIPKGYITYNNQTLKGAMLNQYNKNKKLFFLSIISFFSTIIYLIGYLIFKKADNIVQTIEKIRQEYFIQPETLRWMIYKTIDERSWRAWPLQTNILKKLAKNISRATIEAYIKLDLKIYYLRTHKRVIGMTSVIFLSLLVLQLHLSQTLTLTHLYGLGLFWVGLTAGLWVILSIKDILLSRNITLIVIETGIGVGSFVATHVGFLNLLLTLNTLFLVSSLGYLIALATIYILSFLKWTVKSEVKTLMLYLQRHESGLTPKLQIYKEMI